MMMEKGVFIWATLVLTCGVVLVSSISFEDDVTLTAKEKGALDKFKPLVIPKIPKSSYLQNYVKDDLYFIHWLRAKRLNVQAAEAMLLNHIKWRETENIDSLNEDGFDWAPFNREYPVYFNGTVDRTGRPVGELWFGDWNFRQGALAGQSRQMTRNMARLFEMLIRRLYKARAEGKQVSQTIVLIDIDGFSVLTHACPSCAPVILNMAIQLENHYPYLFDTVFMVNVPQAFQLVLRVVQPVLSESTSSAFKTYNGRNQWMKILDEKVDRSQRSVKFGGTIVRD